MFFLDFCYKESGFVVLFLFLGDFWFYWENNVYLNFNYLDVSGERVKGKWGDLIEKWNVKVSYRIRGVDYFLCYFFVFIILNNFSLYLKEG